MQHPSHRGSGFIVGVKTQCRSIVNQSYQTPIIWGQYPDALRWFIFLHLLFLSRWLPHCNTIYCIRDVFTWNVIWMLINEMIFQYIIINIAKQTCTTCCVTDGFSWHYSAKTNLTFCICFNFSISINIPEKQKWRTERRFTAFMKITDLTDLLSWPKKNHFSRGAAEET